MATWEFSRRKSGLCIKYRPASFNNQMFTRYHNWDVIIRRSLTDGIEMLAPNMKTDHTKQPGFLPLFTSVTASKHIHWKAYSHHFEER